MNKDNIESELEGVLFLDIDGSLLNKEYDTDPVIWDYFSRLNENGFVICLVTARPYAFCRHILAYLNRVNDIHVFDGGANIVSRDGDCRRRVSLPKNVVLGVDEILSGTRAKIRYGLSKQKYFYANGRYFQELMGYMNSDCIKVLERGSSMGEDVCCVWGRDVEDKYVDRVGQEFGKDYFVKKTLQSNGLYSFFVKDKMCNKGFGIEEVLDFYKLDRKDTFAFADGLDDADLFLKVASCACPRNSTEEIKKISSFVSSFKYSQGLIDVIKQVYGKYL